MDNELALYDMTKEKEYYSLIEELVSLGYEKSEFSQKTHELPFIFKSIGDGVAAWCCDGAGDIWFLRRENIKR